MTIQFQDPQTHDALEKRGDALYNARTGDRVADIVHGLPRFVRSEEDYADSFGWQWNRWTDTLSDERAGGTAKRDLILQRTRFRRL